MNRRFGRVPAEERSSQGITLVETVTALTLLALLAAGLVGVSGNGLRAWVETREALRQDRRLATTQLRLHESISSIVPLATPRLSGGAPLPSFQGAQHMMRFVTGYSPTRGGRAGMRLVTLRAIPKPAGVQFIVRDSPCPDPHELVALLESAGDAAGPLEIAEDTDFWIVAEELAACTFEYLEFPTDTAEPERWVSQWQVEKGLPRAVRIRWTARASRGASEGGHQRLVTAAVQAEAESSGGFVR